VCAGGSAAGGDAVRGAAVEAATTWMGGAPGMEGRGRGFLVNKNRAVEKRKKGLRLHAILNLDPSASQKKIKKAYKEALLSSTPGHTTIRITHRFIPEPRRG
jgi:hypothetical protein